VTAPPVRGHLDQVDLFRVLTFAAVVAVHSTAFTNPPVSTAAGGAGQLLHFTREAFFFQTGFVLVHSQGRRPLQLRRFWTRRFRLIGLPYLAWTLLYVLYVELRDGGPVSALPGALARDVVSMQAYLLFPVLLAVLELTRRRPWLLLAGAAVVEVAETLYLHHVAPPAAGPLHWYADWAYALFPSYLLYVVAGALAARHLPAVQGWLLDHRWLVLAGGTGAAAVAEGWFLLAVHRGASAGDGALDASTVLQPVLVLWSCGAIALLALLSCSWAARRSAGSRFSIGLAWASSASFGVYLVHPLVLDGVLALGLHGPRPSLVPQPWASVLAWLATIAGSVCVVAVLRRTPLSLALTGRSLPPTGRGRVVPLTTASHTAPVPVGGDRVPADASSA